MKFRFGFSIEAHAAKVLDTYRVFHIDSPKVFAYCSKNMITSDILSLLGAHKMWSI